MELLYLLLAALAVFVSVLLLQALAFKPREEPLPPMQEVTVDEARALEHLQRMIRCRTVSFNDPAREDEAEFAKFTALLRELYPTVFARADLEQVPPRTLLLTIPGQQRGEPSVFMAHYDVVPVTEEDWEHAPFDAEIVNGELWGRGTLDTKITDLGILEATETLLTQGWTPLHDMVIALGGDEETNGHGAENAAELFRQRGVTPSFVLDEGGAVVENVFPGVTQPCALVGISEKGLANAAFTIEGHGGHASTPPYRSNIGRLSDAVGRLERHPFPARLSPPIAEMFDTLGRRSGFGTRLIFANIGVFLPLLSALYKKKGGELNAMLRTTVAFTQMEGSSAHNVMPPRAWMLANLRLMGGDTVESAADYLRRIVGDGDIRVELLPGANDPAPVSDTHCPQWEQLKRAIRRTWPESVVSPYLMLQCSDSRYYSRISPYVYRFSAMALTSAQRATIHGSNERIEVAKIRETVEFYMHIISER